MGKGILNYDDEESPMCKKAKKSDETKPVASSSSEDEKKKNDGITFKNLGGVDDVVKELKMVICALVNKEQLRRIGVKPECGVLLVGPTGCGKTFVAQAVGNESGLPFHRVSALLLTPGALTDVFAKAYEKTPSIVFIDDLHIIAGKFGGQIQKPLMKELVECMENLEKAPDSKVLVIAATNLPEILDPAIKGGGKFEREICIGLPDETQRLEILNVLIQDIPAREDDIDLDVISKMTRGFHANDLKHLFNHAGRIVMKRICEKRKLDNEDWLTKPWSDEELQSDLITKLDLETAVKQMRSKWSYLGSI